MMKSIRLAWGFFALCVLGSALVLGQSFVEPAGGDGGGGSGTSGAITNLTPIAGSMHVTSGVVTNSTNFSRLFTMFTAGTGSGTNVVVALSGSSAYIRTTNAGWHTISYSLSYRPNVAHNGYVTNAFFISTNVGSAGTNIAGAEQFSAVNRATTNITTVSGSVTLNLESNTYAGLCFYTVGATGAATSTNDISFERASFNMFAIGGGTFGGGTGGGEVTTAQLNTASNAVWVWSDSVSNLAQTKQFGTATLTNLSGTGAVTNLFSPTLSNATIKPLVVGSGTAAGATNTSGRIRGLEAGGNVTLTENGSNVVIAASVSGSGVSTNGNQFDATGSSHLSLKSGIQLTNVDALNITNRGTFNQTGTSLFAGAVTNNDRVWLNERINQVDPANAATFGQLRAQTLLITNWSRILATNLNLAGTNLVADGNLANIFTNAIDGRTAGVTNIVVTNILDGQTIELGLWVTNGIEVLLCTAPAVQIPDAWYTDGVAVKINTNGFTRVRIRREGGWTNVTEVLTPSFAFASTSFDSTNFATRIITRTPFLTFNTNSGTAYQATQFVAKTASIVLSNDATGTVSMHVNRSGLYRTIYVDAAAMVSNITAGATFNTVESQGTMFTTNKMLDYYTFDGAASNCVQFKLAMPLEWDLSTIKVKLWTWSTNNVATTTNVWGVQGLAIKDTTIITNQTWGTEQTITNAVSSDGGAAHLTAATPALTVGNSPAAAGNLVMFRVRRIPQNANDNDSGQQHLLGAWIQYREKEAEEASW